MNYFTYNGKIYNIYCIQKFIQIKDTMFGLTVENKGIIIKEIITEKVYKKMTIQFDNTIIPNKCSIMYEYKDGNITLIKESYERP